MLLLDWCCGEGPLAEQKGRYFETTFQTSNLMNRGFSTLSGRVVQDRARPASRLRATLWESFFFLSFLFFKETFTFSLVAGFWDSASQGPTLALRSTQHNFSTHGSVVETHFLGGDSWIVERTKLNLKVFYPSVERSRWRWKDGLRGGKRNGRFGIAH